MTPTPNQPPANPQPQTSNNKLLIGLLIGCGCLPLGIILLGIIAAISLPSFLNQTSRARLSEGLNNTGTILRGQQAHFLENSKFATSINDLDTRIAGKYYDYQIIPLSLPSNPLSSNPKAIVAGTTVVAIPQQPNIKSVVGAIFADKEGNVVTQTCVSDSPSVEPPPAPQAPATTDETVVCPAGSTSANN
jgi:type IV pilus assembly protein PilA